MIAPALIAGSALAWARALGEFGATITFAGNIQGRTQTTPLAVYNLLESDQPLAIALSLVLLAVSSSCSSRCATTGSEACVTLAADFGVQLGDLDLERRDRRGGGGDRRRARSERRGEVDVAPRARGTGAGRPWCRRDRRRARSTIPRANTFVVPERRSVGVVFQDYLLFPHLTRARERGVRVAQPGGAVAPSTRRRADRVARARRARRSCGREADGALRGSAATGRARRARW